MQPDGAEDRVSPADCTFRPIQMCAILSHLDSTCSTSLHLMFLRPVSGLLDFGLDFGLWWCWFRLITRLKLTTNLQIIELFHIISDFLCRLELKLKLYLQKAKIWLVAEKENLNSICGKKVEKSQSS